MKDTLLSSQASHATRGTVSRQPLGAPDQAYQTETRMSNPNPSPGQSHNHPDRQTASRRLDQAYQIRSPKSTRLTSPATTPNNPETNPDHPTQPATLRQPVRLYPTTIPKSNPDLSGYTLQTHHIHGQPKEERQNHTPTKPPRNPGQPRKDSVYITHLSSKNKIGLARVEIGRGHAARAWWHGAITCGADGSMTRVIAVVFDTPHHV